MESINLGPLAVPVRQALFLLACVIAFFIGHRLSRRRGTDVERGLWVTLAVGVASARIAFVVPYWQSYMANPLAILDIRDGGFSVIVGIVGAVLMAAILAFRNQPWRLPLLASVATGLTIWLGFTAALDLNKQGASIPNVTLSDLDGRNVAVKLLAGKPIVINLWATWCPPCRREMPVLRDAQQANPNVTFVFANQGETGEAVRAFLRAESLELRNILLDQGGSIPRQVGSLGLPTTLFYDSNGTLVDTRVGELSAATLAQRLESIGSK